MKCPACGREMEPGYLQSARPVVFTTRRPSLSGVAFPRIPRGQDLHLKTLSLDGGQVAVDGTVTALIYEEPRREGGFFSRLFG